MGPADSLAPTGGEPERALSRSRPAGRTIRPRGRPGHPAAHPTVWSHRRFALCREYSGRGLARSRVPSRRDAQRSGAPLTGWGGCYDGARGRTRYHVARWPRHRGNIAGSIADEAHIHPHGRPPGPPQARGPCVAPQRRRSASPQVKMPRSCGVPGADRATLLRRGGPAGARRRAPHPPPRWRRDRGGF